MYGGYDPSSSIFNKSSTRSSGGKINDYYCLKFIKLKYLNLRYFLFFLKFYNNNYFITK